MCIILDNGLIVVLFMEKNLLYTPTQRTHNMRYAHARAHTQHTHTHKSTTLIHERTTSTIYLFFLLFVCSYSEVEYTYERILYTRHSLTPFLMYSLSIYVYSTFMSQCDTYYIKIKIRTNTKRERRFVHTRENRSIGKPMSSRDGEGE